MSNNPWPTDDGWPYPDAAVDATDHAAEIDDDLVMLRSGPDYFMDSLDDLERQVTSAHYRLDGNPPKTMKQLHADLGLCRAELREVLGSGLQKLRASLRE